MVHKILVAGEFVETEKVIEVINPYSNEVCASVYCAGPKEIELALTKGIEGFKATRKLKSFERAKILQNLVQEIENHRDEFVKLLIEEGGKVRKAAILEVARAIETITLCAEESKRLLGREINYEAHESGAQHSGYTRYFPIGFVVAVTPFNYPLNLACHKIGPAMATGNAFILKPSEKTPLTALLLATCILTAGYPKEAFSVLPALGGELDGLLYDNRVNLISFTGSEAVGWKIAAKATRQKIVLELGGNAALIVHADADLSKALERAIFGAFTNSGQNCISVQRIFVHHEVYEQFRDRFKTLVETLRFGDPSRDDVDVGPLIRQGECDRLLNWIDAVRKDWAEVLTGGRAQGRVLEPTLIEGVSLYHLLSTEEAFGPVVLIDSYTELDDLVVQLNHSRFGLQTGIFTNDQRIINKVFSEIECKTLVVNDVPTFRTDNMPYGGIKSSGQGLEGVRWAMREMSFEKQLISANW